MFGDENGIGYSKLVDAVNLALYFEGIGRVDLTDKTRYPDWFVKRVKSELLIRDIPLTRLTVEVDPKMDAKTFSSRIDDFVKESTEWVAHLPLLGDMGSKNTSTFEYGLDYMMFEAWRNILSSKNKKGRVSATIIIDRGFVKARVECTGEDLRELTPPEWLKEAIIWKDYDMSGRSSAHLDFGFQIQSAEAIKQAKTIIAEVVEKVRSKDKVIVPTSLYAVTKLMTPKTDI